MSAPDLLARFALGQHHVELTRDTDGTLALWLDGCLRKRRPPGERGSYLWTNVELPFEDHHLVEVRSTPGPTPVIEVRINGALQQRIPAEAA